MRPRRMVEVRSRVLHRRTVVVDSNTRRKTWRMCWWWPDARDASCISWCRNRSKIAPNAAAVVLFISIAPTTIMAFHEPTNHIFPENKKKKKNKRRNQTVFGLILTKSLILFLWTNLVSKREMGFNFLARSMTLSLCV